MNVQEPAGMPAPKALAASDGNNGTNKRLSTKEAADLVGVSYWTLSSWRKKGKGPTFYQLSSRVVFYYATDVDQWLATKKGNK